MEASIAERRVGQEGSRWINMRPSGQEVAEWFADNVQLHDEGLNHGHYVQGLTLIAQKMKENEVVGWAEDNKPIIDERENVVYVPYAKVETRVKYFWDYMKLKGDEFLGVIETVPPVKPVDSLPPGFGYMRVATSDGKQVVYVTCSAQVTVYKRETVKMIDLVNRRTGEITRVREGEIIMQSAPGTKMVATLGRYGADNFSLMKAETGAVGRALGLLGMLVVPGSGVATAEDMQEAMALEGGNVQAAPAPEQVAEQGKAATLDLSDDAALRQRVTVLIEDLGKLSSERLAAFRKWVKEDRRIDALADANSSQLRGLITKLEKEIAEEQKSEAEPKAE